MNSLLEQFQRMMRRYPVAVVSIGLVLVLAGADYYLWRRQAAATARGERVRTEGQTMLQTLSSQPRVIAQAAAAKEALTAINANLASEADLAGNLDYFYQMEKPARIRLASVSQLTAQPSQGDAAYKSIPFSLRLVGPYQQILAYLHEMETGPRLLRIRSFRFAQSDAAVDSLSADLVVEILSRP
jgi:Tfp pilus assembly protein PilO